MSKTYDDLLESAEEDLLAWLQENPDEVYSPDDQIVEIADSTVPVYNYDILMVGLDCLTLACTSPEIIAFNGEITAINVLAGAIFESLEEDLWDYYRGLDLDEFTDQDEEEDEEDD